jgi:hypothetical protein
MHPKKSFGTRPPLMVRNTQFKGLFRVHLVVSSPSNSPDDLCRLLAFFFAVSSMSPLVGWQLLIMALLHMIVYQDYLDFNMINCICHLCYNVV